MSGKKFAIGRTAVLRPDEVEFDPAWPIQDIDKDMEFKKLKRSIRQYGQLTDILVREENGKTIVVTGKRRLLAIQQLGLSGIRCTFVEGETSVVSLIENSTRQKWTTMSLIDEFEIMNRKFQLTENKISEIFGKNFIEVKNMIINNNIEYDIKMKLQYDERISFDALRFISKKYDDLELQIAAIKNYIKILNENVPSPTNKYIKRIHYPSSIDNLIRHFSLYGEKIYSVIDKDSKYSKEEKAWYCRTFISKLHNLLELSRILKKKLPFKSLYERKDTIKKKTRRRRHKKDKSPDLEKNFK